MWIHGAMDTPEGIRPRRLCEGILPFKLRDAAALAARGAVWLKGSAATKATEPGGGSGLGGGKLFGGDAGEAGVMGV